MVKVMGEPVLALAFRSSAVNALHSGPVSRVLSLITQPHEVQIDSPRVRSWKNSLPPHTEHIAEPFVLPVEACTGLAIVLSPILMLS
jgi:hypothetical protein